MTEPISADVLADLERLERAATPGEWGYEPSSREHKDAGVTAEGGGWVAASDDHNAPFIAAARNALPALLTTARRYAELLAGIEGRLLAIQLEASLSRIGSHEELCRSLESIRDESAAALRQLKEQTHG